MIFVMCIFMATMVAAETFNYINKPKIQKHYD
jgi:hypothetical protein